MTGSGEPAENSSLGGVNLVTAGAANAGAAPAANARATTSGVSGWRKIMWLLQVAATESATIASHCEFLITAANVVWRNSSRWHLADGVQAGRLCRCSCPPIVHAR